MLHSLNDSFIPQGRKENNLVGIKVGVIQVGVYQAGPRLLCVCLFGHYLDSCVFVCSVTTSALVFGLFGSLHVVTLQQHGNVGVGSVGKVGMVGIMVW